MRRCAAYPWSTVAQCVSDGLPPVTSLVVRSLIVLALCFVSPDFGLCAVGDRDRNADTAYYDGAISEAQNRRFFESVAGRAITRLVITSSGGEVEAGITLGRWVFERQIDVEVVRYCLSSCANYVFPAGRHKVIRPGAVVAWHGNYHHLARTGLWKDDVARRIARDGEDPETARRKVKAQVERLVRLERAFFRRIGVDQYVCWVGKVPPYNLPNYYFLSKRDMARFGITDVEVPPGYPETNVSGFAEDVRYLLLAD
jgi:hypothetical protein